MESLESFRLIFKVLLLPPGGIILLLLISLWLGRKGRLLVLLATLSLYGLSTSAAVHWLSGRVEVVAPSTPDEIKRIGADALLVLTAAADLNNPELKGGHRPSPMGLERLNYALSLHRQTELPIIITGGRLTHDSLPLARIYAAWLLEQGVEPLAIETRSANTWENLAHSKALMKELQIDRVAIVTHAYHMPRAMQTAESLDMDAVPAPFGYMHKYFESNSVTNWLPFPENLVRSYLLSHELIGKWWYRLRHSDKP